MINPQANSLSFVAQFIETNLGIIYSPDNYFQLENRLEDLVKQYQLRDLDHLIEHLRNAAGSDLKASLLDAATNNETSFFRDPKIFDAFRQLTINEWTQRPLQLQPGQPIRIWSAASSTGQEALSLSMIWQELSQKTNLPALEIYASDISGKALKKAQSGLYSPLEIGRGLPNEMQVRYFAPSPEGGHRALGEIHRRIRFERLNLCEGFRHVGSFHIIFCRNVLIYQRIEKKTDIIKRLSQQLLPGGFLVLGAGESLLGLSDAFEQFEIQGAILYRLRAANGFQAA